MPRGPLIFPSRDGGTQENAQILKINTNTQVHKKYTGKCSNTQNKYEYSSSQEILRKIHRKYKGKCSNAQNNKNTQVHRKYTGIYTRNTQENARILKINTKTQIQTSLRKSETSLGPITYTPAKS